MGDFSSNTTCSRLWAAPPLVGATRPDVLASLRAPGAPLRRLAPDVGAQRRASPVCWGNPFASCALRQAWLWFALAPFSRWRPAYARRARAAPRDLAELARSRASRCERYLRSRASHLLREGGFVRPPAEERSRPCRTTKTPSPFTLTQ